MDDRAGNPLTAVCFENLASFPELVHGVFSRHGGSSDPPFDALNVSFGVGDQPENVLANRRRISRNLGGIRLVPVRQVHGTGVFQLVREDLERHDDISRPPEADAIITDCRGAGLTIQVADCQPVMVYDPEARVAANIHSGWRGSVQNIIGHTITRMIAAYGCRAEHMMAAVGPSLGPCCAEFINYRSEIPDSLWAYRIGKHHFDFWKMSRDQLEAAGITRENIECSSVCTRCHPETYFSYRHRRRTGRFAAVVGLR
jgi:YfiH family protein